MEPRMSQGKSPSSGKFAPTSNDVMREHHGSAVNSDVRQQMAMGVDAEVRHRLASGTGPVSSAEVDALVREELSRRLSETNGSNYLQEQGHDTTTTQEEEDSVVQEFQEELQENKRLPVGVNPLPARCTRRTTIIWCIFILVSVAGGLTAAFLLTGGIGGDDDDGADSPTSVPSVAPTAFPTMSPTFTPAPTRTEFSGTWDHLGQDIEGSQNFDRSGSSVSLSFDGTIMAVGVPRYAPLSFVNGGFVQVFRYDSDIDEWTQLGNNIESTVLDDEFGFAVALAGNGRILAVGAHLNNENDATGAGLVRAFQYNEDDDVWEQMGQDVYGENEGDKFGVSVAVAANGTVWAAGAVRASNNRGVSTGHARIFQYDQDSESWLQKGQTLNGVALGDEFGSSVSLNTAGDVVAVGGPLHDGSQTNAGHVRVFQFNPTFLDWTQKGPDIDGAITYTFNKFGTSVSLSGDGNMFAAGAIDNSHNGTDLAGHVQVFRYDSTIFNWTQVGGDVRGAGPGDGFGYSVSLSLEGNVFAAGAWGFNNPGSLGNDYVRVYQFEPTFSWTQVGQDLLPDVSGEQFGWSVALSANGTSLVVGARLSNAAGEQSGKARFFALN